MAGEPLPSVRVFGEGAAAVRRDGALMVYRKWVEAPRGLPPGSLVVAEDPRGELLGCGFYDTVGPVALRLVELGDCSFSSTEEAIYALVEAAYLARRRIGYAGDPEAGYRLVHSDGDMMPGLIVDVYADLAVYQSSSIVWDVHSNTVAKAISEATGARHVYEKSLQRTRRDIGLPPREGVRIGDKTRAVIREGEARFIVDARVGQKTGFFLDQRLNRLDFGELARGTVLDLFSYTGGFGVQALVNGAERAVFVEEDEKAIKLLRMNLELNRVEDRAEIVQSNVWSFLSEAVAEGREYDSISVDPPAFIPHPGAYQRGLRAYEKLYFLSARLATSGSIIVFSSCSTHLGRGEFMSVAARALARAGVGYRPLGGVRGMPPDHPVRPSSPHLEYLKSLFVLVV
ncbi:class I SAM-dependent rRNA methyltransferase [Pyrodictium abyssi]|uniref:Class I SAM-dependent rRNA methyltransferase n=1 Tax=Pyrodictium abyssi TaxID=54256 RepID=A0ABM8J0N7_9CREN|nr:class I SAM-dependent rRNA methyltransferase [Pyrodictium abyssi]